MICLVAQPVSLAGLLCLLHFCSYVKGALDKCNIISNFFFQKGWDFYTIRSVCMGNDCMLSFTF